MCVCFYHLRLLPHSCIFISFIRSQDDAELTQADLDKCVPPYFEAIELLKQLPALKSASLKLDCLVEVGKRICVCITKFWEGRIDPAKLIVYAIIGYRSVSCSYDSSISCACISHVSSQGC